MSEVARRAFRALRTPARGSGGGGKQAGGKKAGGKKAGGKKAGGKQAGGKQAGGKKAGGKKAGGKKAGGKKADKQAKRSNRKQSSGVSKTNTKGKTSKTSKRKASQGTASKKAASSKSKSKPTKKSPIAKSTIERLKSRLEEEREVYVRQAEELAAEAEALMADREPGDTQFDEESGEGDTINVERERDLALSASALQAVEEIDAALGRIKKGTYGICRRCGNKIPVARLEAVPQAALCIECKAHQERRR